jgi:CheY-like chemotaxis protein
VSVQRGMGDGPKLILPVMNGFAAVQKIREAERQGDITFQLVIALTGNARQAQIDQAIAAGMDDGELRKRLERLLRQTC